MTSSAILPFKRDEAHGIVLWTGDPDCETARKAVRAKLESNSAYLLKTSDELTQIRAGNLGEYISFLIGKDFDFSHYQPVPANALNPLGPISKADLDIVWCYFGASDTEDLILLQEVKTTYSSDLEIRSKLITDYKKLFDTDPSQQLATRLMCLKNHFQYVLDQKHYLKRIDKLQASTPAACQQIKIVPTLVHERIDAKPVEKLIAVRSSLIGLGWNEKSIIPWSISFEDFENRLIQIAVEGD